MGHINCFVESFEALGSCSVSVLPFGGPCLAERIKGKTHVSLHGTYSILDALSCWGILLKVCSN